MTNEQLEPLAEALYEVLEPSPKTPWEELKKDKEKYELWLFKALAHMYA